MGRSAHDQAFFVPARIGLLGGSFNPPHNGHFRLAVEVLERLSLDRVEFLPAPHPPHKPDSGLLPFELRCRMLRAGIGERAGLSVNEMEAARSGPAYTYDTLLECRRLYPDERRYFIVGDADFLTLPGWRNGPRIPEIGNIIVVSRRLSDIATVADFIRDNWPHCAAAPCDDQCIPGFCISRDTEILLLDIPVLDISSSYVRQIWNAGRSTAYLVPEPVAEVMHRERDLISSYWSYPRDDHTTSKIY